MNVDDFSISFVIVNYNNSSYSVNCVISITELEDLESVRVVIVDNSSSSQDRGHLLNELSKFDWVTIILLDDNIGYFPALNIGLDYLEPGKGDFVVVGNNDLKFHKDFYTNLRSSKALIELYPVIAPNIISREGLHQNPHVVSKISEIRLFIYRLYFSSFFLSVIIQGMAYLLGHLVKRTDSSSFEERQTIRMGFGACYVLTPKFFQDFYRLKASVFLMGEESILSDQIYSKGGSILYEPNLIVFHEDNATIGKMPSRKLWEISKKSYKIYRTCLERKYY